MSDIPDEDAAEVRSVARAVRVACTAIVLGISYANVNFALGLHAFGQVFRDMLGNKPLPIITTFVLHYQPFLLGLSLLIPVAAVTLIFMARIAQSIYIGGTLILLAFFQLFFTWRAVSAPLFAIIQNMSAVGQP
ncbi:MAG TPA: hypothetical protein VFD27_19280 [Chthoniobacteraceae bacterium]|nr:hypothetical protein [Chthoniobacteraceae bacterium]